MAKSSAGKASAFSLRVVEQIEEIRIEENLTHQQVFTIAEMSQNYYFTRLRGDLPFNTNDIDKIAGALGCDPMLILRRASQPSLSVVRDADTDATPRAATEKARQRWEQSKGKMAAKRRPKKDTKE